MATATAVRRITVAALLLFCLLAAKSESAVTCPEDSVVGDDGECKCVSPCPKHECQAGQQPVRVREAIPERPGSCCPLYECHNQATLSYLAPDDPGNSCVDDMGQPRELGERWYASDPCTNCTCETGGIHCHTAMCSSCVHPLPRRPGECCPRCPPLPRDDCPPLVKCALECELGLDNDEVGCSICRCRTRDQNEIAGTGSNEEEADVCPRLECELSCEYGLLMDENDCGMCQCRPHPGCPANLVCQHKCPQGYRTNRHGCPICRCRGSCLDVGNVTRPEGSSWRSEPCRSCLCELGGQIRCNETVCSVACSDPIPPPPGHCCPLCPTSAPDESRGWGTVPIVLIVVLALLCILLMVHLVRGRFRARLVPSEADFAGFPRQYYKCVPVYETHVPVLRHAEKIVPL